MKINKRRTIFTLLSVLFLGVYLNYDQLVCLFSNKIMSVNVLAEEELYEVLEGKELILSDDLPTYNDQPAAYDRNSNTIFVPQTLTGHSWEGTLKSEWGKLYLAEDPYLKDREAAMADGYTFKLYQINEHKYVEYGLVFTGMPVLCLFEESSTMEGDRENMHGLVRVYDQYHTSAQFQSAECSFRLRGSSTLYRDKPSYKLKLEKDQLSLLGMREDDDWILNALYDDVGLIHNKISLQVWRQIAASNHVKNDDGTTMEFIEVFLDDEYLGVYGLTERIDQKELSLGKNDILYKWRAERMPEEHNYTNEMTDGLRPIFILKYPKDFDEEDWDPIKVWVDYFMKEEFTDYEEGAAILNMENAVDYNLFCLLSGASDNIRKNIFFIAEYQKDGTYQFKKVPWDMNATWGNPWISIESGALESDFPLYIPQYAENIDTWCTDLNTLYFYNEAEVSRRLLERWEELRGSLISKEKINALLDEQFGYLHASGAYGRNYALWPAGIENWQDEYIYEYVDRRIDFLDQYFAQLYEETQSEKIYNGVDYSEEFDTRYYWEKNKETLSGLYPYDTQLLLEHYALYGKQFGLKARRYGNE